MMLVLENLENPDADKPWLTLFSSASPRGRANQFHIAHVDQKDGAPRAKLIDI